MNTSFCPSCGFGSDAGDNFCRRCGTSIGTPQLPAVRATSATTIWQPNVSPVVKGAVVMAAGTVGQFLVRRAMSGIFGTNGSSRRSGVLPIKRRRGDDGMVDDAQIITETVMMRRVRIRRQP